MVQSLPKSEFRLIQINEHTKKAVLNAVEDSDNGYIVFSPNTIC